MSKTKDRSVTWHFLAGLLITEAGFWLLAFGELYTPGTWMPSPFLWRSILSWFGHDASVLAESTPIEDSPQ
jgi:hypothetical protein